MLVNLLSVTSLSVYRALAQFLLTLGLTRILQPSEFGVVAFVFPFMLFSALIAEFGIGSAIVREPILTRSAKQAAFTLSLIMSGILALCMLLASTGVDGYIDTPAAGSVMAAFAGVTFLSMACLVPRSLLERDLRYKRIAVIEASCTTLAACVSVALALSGAGVWSLVGFYIAVHTLRFAAFWPSVRQELALTLHLAPARQLVRFGGWVFAFNLQNFFARNADNIIIGNVLGAAALGVYALAYQVMTLPLILITWPASGVLVATLSRLSDDQDATRRYVGALVTLTAAIAFPMMGYLALGLNFPARTFMSPSWHSVAGLVLWLAPVGACHAIASYCGAVLVATGRVRLQLAIGFVITIILLLGYVLSAPHGLMAVVQTYAVLGGAAGVFYCVLLAVLTGTSAPNALKTLMPGAVAATAGVATFLLLAKILDMNITLSWTAATLAFAIAAALALLLTRRSLIVSFKTLRDRSPIGEAA